MLLCGELTFIRWGARVRINVQTDCHTFVAMEVLWWGQMAILRTLCRTCGARARVWINVQTDCHRHTRPLRSSLVLCAPPLRNNWADKWVDVAIVVTEHEVRELRLNVNAYETTRSNANWGPVSRKETLDAGVKRSGMYRGGIIPFKLSSHDSDAA